MDIEKLKAKLEEIGERFASQKAERDKLVAVINQMTSAMVAMQGEYKAVKELIDSLEGDSNKEPKPDKSKK